MEKIQRKQFKGDQENWNSLTRKMKSSWIKISCIIYERHFTVKYFSWSSLPSYNIIPHLNVSSSSGERCVASVNPSVESYVSKVGQDQFSRIRVRNSCVLLMEWRKVKRISERIEEDIEQIQDPGLRMGAKQSRRRGLSKEDLDYLLGQYLHHPSLTEMLISILMFKDKIFLYFHQNCILEKIFLVNKGRGGF